MFTIPEGQSFWQSFSDQVVHFKELTKDMPEEKVFSLMSDPACSGKYDRFVIYVYYVDCQVTLYPLRKRLLSFR